MLGELQRGCDRVEDRWVVAVDSTVVRAHHHAAGARKEPPRDVPAAVLDTALSQDPGEPVTTDARAEAAPDGLTGGWLE